MRPSAADVFAFRTPAPPRMFCAISVLRYGTGRAEGMAGRRGTRGVLEVDQRPLQVAQWPCREGEWAHKRSPGAAPIGAKSLQHLLGWQQTGSGGPV
jgi:hypothetical protein